MAVLSECMGSDNDVNEPTDNQSEPVAVKIPPPPPVEPQFERPQVPLLGLGALIATVMAGVAIDLALRQYPNSIVATVAVAVVAGVLLMSGTLETRASKVLVVLAPVFGLWLSIRASAPLITIDVFAILGLLVLGVALSKRGRFFDYRFSWLLQSTAYLIEDAIMAGPYASKSVVELSSGRNRETVRQVLVGIAIATPILLLVGVLLAEADSEFASIFGWLGTTGVFGHIALIAIGSLIVIMLMRGAHADRSDFEIPGTGILAPATSLVIILGFVGLYSLFVGTQVVDVLNTTFSHDEIRDYARSGFFQLLWVAVITLVTLMVVPAVTKEATEGTHRKLRHASAIAIGLTVIITAMSVRRLVLFIQIDELTMLRSFALAAAATIGAIFVLLAAKLWGWKSERDWFVGATISVLLLVVFGFNVANPEAIVARYNTGSTDKIESIDMWYLGQLSADAVPTLVAVLDDLPSQQAEELQRSLCDRHFGDDQRSGLGYNRATVNAKALVSGLECGQRG